MSKTELSRAMRGERKRKRLKEECCLSCGATEISTLQSVTLCAGCRLLLQSGAFTEEHHVIGRKYSSFTIPIPANVHAILSDMALDHPRAISRDLKVLYSLKDALELLYETTLTEIENLDSRIGN